MSSEMPQPQHTQQAVAVALSDAHGVEPINGTAFVDFCFFHDKDVVGVSAIIGAKLMHDGLCHSRALSGWV